MLMVRFLVFAACAARALSGVATTTPLSTPTSATAPALRVLPLGDSLTAGCGSTANPASNWTASCGSDVGGYRLPLWAALTAAGVNATMVGTQRSGPSWAPPAATSHEGHPGWRTDQLLHILPAWAATQPDIILLTAGTNNVGQGRPLPEALADMGALLGNISVALPTARTFVCTILDHGEQRPPRVGPCRGGLQCSAARRGGAVAARSAD
jgi:hypothetical protein